MPTLIAPSPSRARWKQYLHPATWKGFLSKAQADRGLERYRRASITASTSFLSKALTILIGFVSVPLTIHYLGAERYGVWLTISSLLTWMSLTDFGIAGNALVNVIAEASGKDDRNLAREYSASAFWALLAVSTTLGLGLALGFHAIPWRSVFRVSSSVSTHELDLACALTLGMFAVNMPLNMLNSIYSAYQDGFVSNVWGIVSNAAALLGLIIVTQFQGGLPALIFASFGIRTMVSMVNAVYLFSHRYPWLRPALTAVRRERISRLLKLGGKYMVTQLASLGIYQSQPIIITQLLGPSKVAIFVIAYKIITFPVDLSYIATAPFISAISEAKSRSDWKWIRGAFQNTTLLCLAIGTPVTVAIALCGKFLVRLLAGAQAVPDWGVIFWLSVYTLVGMALMATGQVLCGIERVGKLAISLTAASILTVTLGIWFAHPWGVAGVAAGMAIAKIVTYLPMQGYEIQRALYRQSSNTSDVAMIQDAVA